MNLKTRINKAKEWLEHLCKPLTHVERLEAICWVLGLHNHSLITKDGVLREDRKKRKGWFRIN